MVVGRTKVKDLYRSGPVPQSQQQRILELVAEGIPNEIISRIVGLPVANVESVKLYGIVAIAGLDKPERCKCGAKIVAKPCLRCQLVEGLQ